ncbi:DUF6483 family protein [Enterococcus pallens]|uniref:Uncharacterized protein n=1 Tax=Enterococcus pallens ATCC BAA-351 TaxID=1158607 RepID=R2Q4H9_9ENTE|nr:DUF6483 family protein [Enterococcus pallens]EOH90233.1 hypothetical protein UAU_04062 [Enterococcus pallens ATCC BAA-351]EOU15161.1 hypothetical protein I588_04093 [Enterococcus pallens ATCC BAA-351]OJG79107.1 hypothetical protein RV10_GL000940 [Enterococcus pallens]
MQEDWLMRQLQIVPKQLPTIKQTNNDPLIEVEDSLTGEKRSVSLTQYMHENVLLRNICEAEDVFFAHLHLLTSHQITSISSWFYRKLANISETELLQANFSVEEIRQGQDEIQRLLSQRDN